MRKMLIALFFVFSLIASTQVMAGQGFTSLYCPRYDDTSGLQAWYWKYKHFVMLSNPNGTDAIVKIKYYDTTTGAPFNNTSSFTHTIPANGMAGWRPSDDLKLPYTTTMNGSYAITATTGSVVGSSYQMVLAGDILPGIGTDYNSGDFLGGLYIPLDITPSSQLFLDAYWVLNANGTHAMTLGEYNTAIQIFNPNDQIAKIKFYMYDMAGNPITLTTTEATLPPHASLPTAVNLLGANATLTPLQGKLLIDCEQGSVVAQAVKERVSTVNNRNIYEYYVRPFTSISGR
jgi:hypothetical protein